MRGNSNGFAQIIIVIVLILLAGGAIYYFGIKKVQFPVNTVPTSTPAETTQPSQLSPGPKLNPDITINWKTYTNADYKFSFNYPTEYLFYNEKSENDGSLAITFRHKNFGRPLSNSPDAFYENEIIQISLKQSPLTPEDFVSNKLGLPKLVYGKQRIGAFSKDPNSTLYYLVEIGKKSINGSEFIYFNYAGAAAGNWSYITKDLRSSTVATLNWNYPDYFDEVYIDQILSTFKFSN